jgi:uncharacterized ferritin-like protein (DUF455 family)
MIPLVLDLHTGICAGPTSLLGSNSIQTRINITVRHQAPRLRPPFNTEARRAAGFTEAEIDLLA